MPKKKNNEESNNKVVINDNYIAHKDVSAIDYSDMDMLMNSDDSKVISPADAVMLRDLLNPAYNGAIDPKSEQYRAAFSKLINDYMALVSVGK